MHTSPVRAWGAKCVQRARGSAGSRVTVLPQTIALARPCPVRAGERRDGPQHYGGDTGQVQPTAYRVPRPNSSIDERTCCDLSEVQRDHRILDESEARTRPVLPPESVAQMRGRF